jgi:hypothetical protein
VVESYVIRIYRRTDSDPQQVAGIVERAVDGRQQRFATMHELWEILTAPDINGGEEATGPDKPQDQ